MMVNRTEDRRGVIRVQKGARAIVNGFARDRHVIGVHHPVNETPLHPARHQRGLRLTHSIQECQVRGRTLLQRRVMPRDRVIGQGAYGVQIAPGGEIFKGADAQVTCRDAGQHRPRQHRLAKDRLAGRDDRQCTRRRDTQRLHRLADDVFTQHGTERGPAITTA